jgi:hypothetical protein
MRRADVEVAGRNSSLNGRLVHHLNHVLRRRLQGRCFVRVGFERKKKHRKTNKQTKQKKQPPTKQTKTPTWAVSMRSLQACQLAVLNVQSGCDDTSAVSCVCVLVASVLAATCLGETL